MKRTWSKKKPRYDKGPKADRTCDDILFDSKKEMRRYEELKLLRGKGVDFFLRQVPMHLPGGTRYVLDFLVFWSDGVVTFEDVKGHRTQIYKIKKREVEAQYGIEIKEI